MTYPPRQMLRASELVLGLLLFVWFLVVRDLPLVDLPQHALQIAQWLRIDAKDAGSAELWLNFRTPYLLAYPVARALASWMPALEALKVVLAAAIVLQAVALRRLCSALGHDPWLGLLGFPLGLGFCFCFGFVSFVAAVPLIYLAFTAVVTHSARPSRRTGSTLAALLALLLLAHGAAFAYTIVLLTPVLLRGQGRWWQRLSPLALPASFAAVWLVPSGNATRLGADLWRLEAKERLFDLPGRLVGIGADDWCATLGGLAVLLLVTAGLGAPRPLPYFAPLIFALLGYFLFPTLYRGVGLLAPRFAVFVVPALLLAFAPRPLGDRWKLLRRASTLALAGGLLLVFCVRLLEFNRETAELRALIGHLPPGLRLRPLVFARESAAFPGIPAHLHTPAYYAVEKGGHPGYSFAMYSISVVRFRPGAPIRMGGGEEWVPERFDAEREAADYDYFLVRSREDRTKTLFPGPEPLAVLERRHGAWWGYRRRSWSPQR